MRRPGTVEGYKPCGVHGAHKDVLRDKVAFAPSKQLFSSLQTMQCRVPTLAHMHKPIPVRVIAMLEPFVDEHVGRVVIESFADEFAHGDARGLYWGVKTSFFGGHCRGMGLCGKGVGVEIRQKVSNPTRKSPDLNASRTVAYLIRLPLLRHRASFTLTETCKVKEYLLGFIQDR
jgi:hypothetical protein